MCLVVVLFLAFWSPITNLWTVCEDFDHWRQKVLALSLFLLSGSSVNCKHGVLPTLGGLRTKGRVEERVADREGSVFLGPGVLA